MNKSEIISKFEHQLTLKDFSQVLDSSLALYRDDI